MRKRRPEFLSVRKSRQLGERPVALVAESDWPSRFPIFGKAVDTS